MHEFTYEISSFWIAAFLFGSMTLAIEAGYRIGLRNRAAEESSRAQVSTIQASMLGILALLLGFTFSLSLQRFDSRSMAVVDEANAIGTAYLRAELLPNSVRGEVKKLLRQYLDLREQAGVIALDRQEERRALTTQSGRIQNALWEYASHAAKEDANPVTTGLFIQALNELIDSFGRRDAALDRHVPELVLLLLYATFLMAGVILGYTSGIVGQRASVASYIMVALIVLLVFIIIDLDRPRRGLITVSHKSLTELRSAIDAETSADTQ